MPRLYDDVIDERQKDVCILKVVGPIGLTEAARGVRLSKTEYDNLPEVPDVWEDIRLLNRLNDMGDDHGAGSRMVWWWISVRGPLYFWRQFDKYRFVNKLDDSYEERSESTMHGIQKRPLTADDFTAHTEPWVIERVNQLIANKSDIDKISSNLPSGFLQTRVVNANLTCIRKIIQQRKKHRLGAWEDFITELLCKTTIATYM